MRNVFFLAGTNPPQRLSAEQIAQVARRTNYQPRQMAIELGLTPRTFERRFRRVFECTPREWLVVEKMREAASLLTQGWDTKEIAAALGYGHMPSFFRQFRRMFGCTTTEWQERLAAKLNPESSLDSGQLSQNAIFLSQNAISPRLQLTEAI